MGLCNLCNEAIPDPELIDHIRLMHPDAWGDGPERWPDGSYVVHDNTLEPSDFTEKATSDFVMPPICPRCDVACVWEGSRVGNPPVVIERHYCPKCGWNPEVDDAND